MQLMQVINYRWVYKLNDKIIKMQFTNYEETTISYADMPFKKGIYVMYKYIKLIRPNIKLIGCNSARKFGCNLD